MENGEPPAAKVLSIAPAKLTRFEPNPALIADLTKFLALAQNGEVSGLAIGYTLGDGVSGKILFNRNPMPNDDLARLVLELSTLQAILVEEYRKNKMVPEPPAGSV